jgi:hypothetical protein
VHQKLFDQVRLQQPGAPPMNGERHQLIACITATGEARPGESTYGQIAVHVVRYSMLDSGLDLSSGLLDVVAQEHIMP